MKTYKFAVIGGDGTGPEVVREALKVVDAAAARTSLLAKHRIAIRAVDPAQWNGLRASLHVYVDDTHVDMLVAALRDLTG